MHEIAFDGLAKVKVELGIQFYCTNESSGIKTFRREGKSSTELKSRQGLKSVTENKMDAPLGLPCCLVYSVPLSHTNLWLTTNPWRFGH